MKNLKMNNEDHQPREDSLSHTNLKRRSFLKFTGATLATSALLATACNKNKDGFPDMEDGVYMGKGDVAILNYAYILEQLEAAFYTKIAESPYGEISDLENSLLVDIRDHEIAHREFFKLALGDNAIPDIEVDFSSINFSNRDNVLAAAKAFEDLGVSAYNGAGQLIQQPEYLLLAGKIASVEARHAALIRDLVRNGTFADDEVVDANGLEISKSPSDVLTAAAPFIKTKINARDLPTY
ncbi:ferritin-like domain-containing protein [Olivibacter sp. SDN3]|uniref:ferritin-like domain-containing protein n=1 Tax=Olivibacter sp. SDN3 TaxID=2764720 RepID=UPI001651694F|nr:ferritin-like domain-containing protein [Olivibacter sp. SDN3]QNL48921.1 ferritin-like domain-containing protein [Olivibacter sp. SDN3]